MLSSDWCRDGLMIPGTDNQWLVVRLLSVEGKFVKAHEFGQQVQSQSYFIYLHLHHIQLEVAKYKAICRKIFIH